MKSLPMQSNIFALSTSNQGAPLCAPWIDSLVLLGQALAKYSRRAKQEEQLIIALTLPQRDLAVALIGLGWVMSSMPDPVTNPEEQLKALAPHVPVRFVTEENIVIDSFHELNDLDQPTRARIGKTWWILDKIRSLNVLPENEHKQTDTRTKRPQPNAVAEYFGVDKHWDLHLVNPKADLAIIGTRTQLEKDFQIYIDLATEPSLPVTLNSLIMPNLDRAATTYTKIHTTHELEADLYLDSTTQIVLLDGNSPTQYLDSFEVPLVVCVLDRSVMSETGAENILQIRNTEGDPVDFSTLNWYPTQGIEALAFTVSI